MDGQLTPKQERFCQEYIIDLNATQAAIRVGYSEKTAQQQSSRLLLNVVIQNRIKELLSEVKENTLKTREEILAQVLKHAFGDVSRIIEWNESGVSFIRNSEDISPDDSCTIKSIQVTEDWLKEDKLVKKTKLALTDPLKALELYAKMTGMIVDKHVIGDGKDFKEMTKDIMLHDYGITDQD
jgi:phage terminase small subunit